MYILGISAFYHDSAACLLLEGKVIAAAQEERFTRIKHDAAFPVNAIKFCLDHAGISFDRVEYVGFYEKPHLKFQRILQTYVDFFPAGYNTFQSAMELWTNKKWEIPAIIRQSLFKLSPTGGEKSIWDGRIVFSEHHDSHISSAFFPSPFKEAAILSIDGVGEWTTTSMASGQTDTRGISNYTILKEIEYPDSLGLLYSAITYFLGFKVNSGEYKVMGLAPYGVPRYTSKILDNLIDLREDGSFKINMDYFSYPYDHIMIRPPLEQLFGISRRKPEDLLTNEHFDIAASLQQVTETVVIKLANQCKKDTGHLNLCMAGGVALNCVANGKILQQTGFRDLWIQPAAGDAGGALGVCYYIWHHVLGERKTLSASSTKDNMAGSYLGPEFSSEAIQDILDKENISYYKCRDEEELVEKTIKTIADEKVVGWFQGRMEFGPRALGNRSIIGDPRSLKMQHDMNVKIKYRESFRPFAPSVLREHVQDWFEIQGKEESMLGALNSGYDSPYMLLVAPVKNTKRKQVTAEQENLFGIEKLKVVRSEIPSCTHVDYSARIQTVHKDTNGLYHKLISAFYESSGIPVLINTSFNVRGEPIVCSPSDALRCFLGTEMDFLVMGLYIVSKTEISEDKLLNYKDKFELD
ncbi:MAG: carbamoyltransferase [Bacteroidia bacterium]